MNATITADLIKIIAEELDVNIKAEEISGDMPFFEDGIGLDSVAIMEFIVLIEKKYNFKFSDEELNFERFKNLATLAAFITEKQQE
ncbi:MAG: phosphopantetheine-binding protein [Candidatus Brocadiaceae bacterium]|nr:phosphopantetheine-binding protein [Candidatus Brocadiaceae bacterium]